MHCPPPREIEKVAAFARLYGVVRFFYPSDAAAELDWNRFAVHGVGRVRAARNAAELGATLKDLFAPLGPGLEIGTTLAPAATAAALRGKAIRLRAQVRATAADPSSGAALWLRVDRPNRAMGFFENMGNRLVREPEWRPYTIEGTVADDAENVALGVMAVGGAVTADFDAVELAVKSATSDWTPVPIQDSGFEEAVTERQQGGWFRTGPSQAAESVMGYVGDRHLGTIVGSPTAGTNGNVASFVTPSGFRVSFTGMRVTRHDGHSPHHLVGVRPDVALAPTLEGVRAGRDELLERRVQLARGSAASR